MTGGHQMHMTREKTRFFLGLGVLIGLLYLSVLRQQPMQGFEYAILLSLTIAFLVFDYLKVSRFLALVEQQEQARRSHDHAIQTALTATLKSPLLVKLLRAELLTLYYAFFAKFENRVAARGDTRFSYAKSSNAHDVFLFVAFSQLPFLPFIHAVVEIKKGPGPAWVITLLTLWSVIWFLAQVEAIKFRPIELKDGHLKYRHGLSWSANIPVEAIKAARCVHAGEVLSGNELFLSPIGSTRNIILEFREPVQFAGPYPMKRSESKAAIGVDNPSLFLRQLALKGVPTA